MLVAFSFLPTRPATLDTRKLANSQTRRSGEAPSTGIAMASEDLRDVRPAYVTVFALATRRGDWAIVGVFLYAVFTFMPMAVQIVIVVTG